MSSILECPKISDADARTICESFLPQGRADWNGNEALIECPGIAYHTGANSSTDCKVVAAPGGVVSVPGIYCFHDSCAGVRDEINRNMRAALGKAAWEKSPQLKRGRVSKSPPKRIPLPKPDFSPALLEQVAGRSPMPKDTAMGREWLAARSPRRVDTQTPASFLHQLSLPGDKFVVFDVYRSQGSAVWENPGFPFDAGALDQYREGCNAGVWWLSNPVTGEFINKPLPKDPEHRTRRSEENVTDWRHMLLESDKANPAHWLAALAILPLPIVSLVTSGGDSVHALIRMDAGSKEEWDRKAERLERTLVTLGADAAAMSAVRLTRLPCCLRYGKTVPDAKDKSINHYIPYEAPRMQELLFLNPDPDCTPICELPIL